MLFAVILLFAQFTAVFEPSTFVILKTAEERTIADTPV